MRGVTWSYNVEWCLNLSGSCLSCYTESRERVGVAVGAEQRPSVLKNWKETCVLLTVEG